MGLNVAQVLRQGALRHGNRVAVLELGPDGSVITASYGELDLAARRVASALRGLGLEPGEPVGMMAANSRAFVAAWFGAAYAGCPIVPMPILSAAPEVAFRLQHARARAVLVDPPRRATAASAGASIGGELRVLDVTSVSGLDDGPSSRAGGAHPDTGELDSLPGPADRSPEDTAMILYTSGTTGKPKGAAISQAALMMHTAVMAHHTLRLGPDDVVGGVLPLSHSYGCRMVMLASFFAGARCVLFPRFDAAASLSAMAAHKVSWLPAVPTMFAAWGNLEAGPALPRLRWALSAGAPLADEVVSRAEARLGAEVRQGFGMTEATFVSVNGPPDARTLGSVGRPVWGVEVRIVDGSGAPLPHGRDGQVLVRGHNMMSGYLHDAEATDVALEDGFMHTGDVGRVDADGRLFIVDRIKDMIIRGGNNVYPSEVEAALASHPAVAEVAVVGRPDDYYGEEVVAVLVPRAPLTAEEVQAWARERVAATKVPREVAFVDALPVGPSGKVLKRQLRADLASGALSPAKVAKAPS